MCTLALSHARTLAHTLSLAFPSSLSLFLSHSLSLSLSLSHSLSLSLSLTFLFFLPPIFSSLFASASLRLHCNTLQHAATRCNALQYHIASSQVALSDNYVVATMCRLPKILGLFCKRVRATKGLFCKRGHFGGPTNRCHPVVAIPLGHNQG